MDFREYLQFLFGALRTQPIKGMATAMAALSLGAVLVAIYKKKSRGGSQPEAQGRRAA